MPWGRVLPIIMLCILILICICILWWKPKEGFQVQSPPPFTCRAGETQIPCPDGRQAICCQNNGDYSIYNQIRKQDGPAPTAPAAARLLVNYKPVDTLSDAYKADTVVREAYQEYQDAVDEADEENEVDPTLEPPPELLPDVGTSLGTLDSSISNIPWDSDNASALQKDTVWGYVSPEASKSIWNKAYYMNLFGDLGNISSDESGRFTYQSPVMGISVRDKNAGAAAAVGDFLIMNAVAPAIQNRLSTPIQLTPSTQRLQTPITKVQRPVGPHLKSKVGGGKFSALRKAMSNRYTKWFSKKMQSFMGKFMIKKAALIGSLQATAVATGIATAGAGLPQAQSVVAMVSAVLEVLSLITMAISIIMAPVLEQLIDGEGMCPNDYKALDKVIPVPAQSFISMFIPVIGDIVDLFYPYVCFRKPRDELTAGLVCFVAGQFPAALPLFITAAVKDTQENTPWIVTKKRLESQPYTEDNTLSVAFTNQIQPAIDGNGVGIIPPPLENFQIQNADGSKSERDWCNFANPIMLDRMANFYYKNASAYKETNDDGTVTFSYISRFLGVVASSELSCDVACAITKVTFDPANGDKVDVVTDTPFYRRFYFVKEANDPQGYFTVTGCTYDDDTAPDATAVSSEEGANYVPSLPKVFNVRRITPAVNVNQILAGVGTGIIGFGLQAGGGLLGAVVNAVASSKIEEGLLKASEKAIKPGQPLPEGAYIYQAGPNNLILQSTSEYFNIDRGAVIESSFGYAPEINFCVGSQVSVDQCTDQLRLRSMVDKYHAENPTRRIKIIRVIEPRGVDACYYKWDETAYVADTNDESIDYQSKEILLYYKIMDTTTCVWGMDRFGPYETAADVYKQPRTIPIPVAARKPGQGIYKYPTRKAVVDKLGNTTWVPIHPSKPFIVPRTLPPKATLGGGTGTCDSRKQIEQCITDFNKAHTDRKIQAVKAAWTAKPDRCDYLVDMLRVSGEKRVIQRESVAIQVKDAGSGLFTRVSDGSDKINSGTFIQPETPFLSTPDTSGGIFGYKAVITALQTTFNNIIKPIVLQKPEVKLPEIATAANRGIESLSQLIFNNQTLKACPAKKCSDPDILAAIYTRYNTDNNPTEQYEVDVHTMTRILKAGVASETECDVIFQDQNQSFSDLLLEPTSIVNTGMSYRFKLTPTGDACSGVPYKVLPNDYKDVSGAAIGVRSDSTTIYDANTNNIGFRVPLSTVDCRKPAILTAIKNYLNTYNVDNNPGEIHTYKTVDWSLNVGQNTCEYKITKDMKVGKTLEKNIETYLRVDTTTMEVEEYNLDYIEIDDEGYATEDGEDITLPFLASYEEATMSPKVNAISINFP
jgi:hypothetical protein